jgi:hypothetical protein
MARTVPRVVRAIGLSLDARTQEGSTMSDLFDFKAYEPGGKTSRFDLPIRGALVRVDGSEELTEGQPYLVLSHAGDSNKPYMNAVARATTRAVRGKRQSPSAERVQQRIKEDRDQDRVLFPDHVVKGWGNIPGANREPVEYSRAACKELCAKLPDWLFDRMRQYAGNPLNFIEDDDDAETAPEDADVEELAGN